MKKKWIIIVVIIIIVIIALLGVAKRFLDKRNNGEELNTQKIKITPQMITSVERGDLKKTVSTSGYLQPSDEKLLTFNLNGEIEEILIVEGQRISEGEELMRLEKSQQELSYLEAKNAYESIKIDGSESKVKEQELNLKVAEKNLEDTTLKAPFSGLITEVSIEAGDYITPGTKVAYLIDDSSYEIEVSVNEIDSLEIEVGQEAIITLDAFPGREFSGKVKEIYNYTENVDGVVTLPVIVQLDNVDKQFKPGFSALPEIIVDKAEGKLLIPVTATLDHEGRQMVVKVIDNKPRLIPIKTGISDGVYTVIEDGLVEGEQILINVYELAGFGSNAASIKDEGKPPMFPGMGGGGPPR